MRQVEILGLALDTRDLQLLHHLGDELQRLIHGLFALDLDQHGRFRHLVGGVAYKVLVCVNGRVKREVYVQGLALDVDTGKVLPALLEGLALPAGARLDLFVGKQLVFDCSIVILQLVGGLDETGEEGTLVADLDRPAQSSGCCLCCTALLCLLALAALALQPSCLFLGTADLLGEDVIGLERHDNGLTDAQLILGELLFIVH